MFLKKKEIAKSKSLSGEMLCAKKAWERPWRRRLENWGHTGGEAITGPWPCMASLPFSTAAGRQTQICICNKKAVFVNMSKKTYAFYEQTFLLANMTNPSPHGFLTRNQKMEKRGVL